MGLQEAQRHRQRDKYGGVLAQARQPQQQAQQQPRHGAANGGDIHQVQGQPHHRHSPKYQQGVGQESNAQHMQQGRKGQHQHRPKACTPKGQRLRASLQTFGQAMHQQCRAQPQQFG